MAAQELERKPERERIIRPACLVCEADEGSIVMKLEMPGVNQDNLELHFENNILEITGRRAVTSQEGTYLVRERRFGTFYQAYTLDNTIEPDKIEASLVDGVLTVTLHRREAEKPRRITVKSG
jgi:HSP20 family protein